MVTRKIEMPYAIDLVIQGIQGALADLRGGRTPPVHPHVQAAQAIYWICVFDDLHKGTAGYKTQRDETVGGGIIAGLRFARNAVTHGVVALAEVTGETVHYPGYESVGISGQWTWRTRADLTTEWGNPDPKINTEEVQTIYVNSVAGREVAEPIFAAYEWVKQWSKIRYSVYLT